MTDQEFPDFENPDYNKVYEISRSFARDQLVTHFSANLKKDPAANHPWLIPALNFLDAIQECVPQYYAAEQVGWDISTPEHYGWFIECLNFVSRFNEP